MHAAHEELPRVRSRRTHRASRIRRALDGISRLRRDLPEAGEERRWRLHALCPWDTNHELVSGLAHPVLSWASPNLPWLPRAPEEGWVKGR